MRAEEIERLIRGLNPWPSAYTSYNNKTMKLWKARVVPGGEAVPGQVLAVDKKASLSRQGMVRFRYWNFRWKARSGWTLVLFFGDVR